MTPAQARALFRTTGVATTAGFSAGYAQANLFAQGSLIDEPSDATDYWTDNTVAFLIGCSFTFEQALLDNGVPVAHIDQGVNAPMYLTNIDCEPAGAFSGKMVVSMRPIPAGLVADAVRITSRYPAVHGAPVHVGEPGLIGIDDLAAPDFGDAVDIPAGWVPVFWACGVTPQSIVQPTPSAYRGAPCPSSRAISSGPSPIMSSSSPLRRWGCSIPCWRV